MRERDVGIVQRERESGRERCVVHCGMQVCIGSSWAVRGTCEVQSRSLLFHFTGSDELVVVWLSTIKK